MELHEAIEILGIPIIDVDQEVFDLFSQTQYHRDLGMVDPSTDELTVSLGDHDVQIKQSATILNSKRDGGTTGAAMWQTSLRVAEWIALDQSPFFRYGLLTKTDVVLELGCGVAGILPSLLAPKVGTYVATDQRYILRLLAQNLSHHHESRTFGALADKTDSILPLAFDWETDHVGSLLGSHGFSKGVDVVISCDCVYNSALIPPLVDAMTDISRLRRDFHSQSEDLIRPTVCVVAHQLRHADILEEWLCAFLDRFKVWRLKDEALSSALQVGSGFAVYLGVIA